MPDAIVNAFELGDTVDDLLEGYPTLSREQIRQLLTYARALREQPVA